MPIERAMPQYVCHKQVSALKISKVDLSGKHGDGAFLEFDEEDGFAPREVSYDYITKHKPEAGGYFVQYEDGYESFSPGDVFEAGYTAKEYGR
jgi:hypothetical protein